MVEKSANTGQKSANNAKGIHRSLKPVISKGEIPRRKAPTRGVIIAMSKCISVLRRIQRNQQDVGKRSRKRQSQPRQALKSHWCCWATSGQMDRMSL